MIDEAIFSRQNNWKNSDCCRARTWTRALRSRWILIGQQPCRLDSAGSVRGLGPADLSPLRVGRHGSRRVGRLLATHRAGRPTTRSSPTIAGARMHRYANGIPVPQRTQHRSALMAAAPTKRHRLTTSARRSSGRAHTQTEQARVATAPIGGHHVHRSAPSRVLTQSCRTVLTQ